MSAGTSVPEQAARLVERAQKVALCLDFDGTLGPIVEDPQAARPLPGIVELLGPLAERFAAVALVSGRPAAYLAEHAAARGVRYLGLYGLQEIREGQLRVDPRLKAARPAVLAAGKALRNAPAVRDSGAWLEDKEYAVAVHTRRLADPASGPARSTRPPGKSPGSTPSRSSRGSWSGSCGRRCAATKATRSAGSSPSPAPATWWSSATISATCPPSPR